MRVLVASVAIAAGAAVSHGQITADGTLGSVVGGGPNVTISGGTAVGGNLFHSLSQFNVATGESATFTGAAGTRNVLARVTGGSPSTINGGVRCTIAGANLYLINPAGVIFGAGASLDVSGNFAASTAHHVTLADGGRFDTLDPQQSSLSAADPASFGFLRRADRAAVEVNAAVLDTTGGEVLLAGGDITLRNGFVRGLPGGVGLAAVGATGPTTQVPVSVSDLADLDPPGDGRVTLTNASRVRVSGDASDRIVIRAGRLVVERSSIDALASGVDGGSIDIAAGVVVVRDQGLISVSAPLGSTGDAGRIDLRVTQRLGVTNTSDAAKGGSNQVTGVAAQSQPGATGAAGSIRVDAQDAAVVLTNEGVLSSTSFTVGAGGDVDVTARRLTIDGEGTRPTFFTGVLARTKATSPGGRVRVVADTVDVRNEGRIATSTINLGRAGRLEVQADYVTVTGGGRIESTSVADPDPLQPNDPRGRAGKLDVRATESLVIADEGAVSVQTDVDGDGGSIRLAAPQVQVTDGAEVVSRSTGEGDAGRIVIDAGRSLRIDEATVSASARFRESGDITLQAGRDIQVTAGRITNRAVARDGGNINMFAPVQISVLDSRIVGRAGRQGGQITIDPDVVLLQSSLINGKSDLGGEDAVARDVLVTIEADNFILSQDSLILTQRQQFEPTQLAGQIVGVSASLGGQQVSLDDACTLHHLAEVSTLTRSGRGGVSLSPGDWLGPPPLAPDTDQNASSVIEK